MSSCPTAPFPGLVKGSPGHTFSLAATVLFVVYIVGCVVLFYIYRKTSVFLRKRSFKLLIVGAIGTIIPWSCTALYDYLGSEAYPCGIYIFLVYASNSAVSYPLVLKIATYQNQVSLFRLGRELQDDNRDTDSMIGSDPLKGEMSARTFAAYLRVAFCFSRSRSDRIFNAKFARTLAFPILWFLLTSFPFYLVYFIRLAMNPQWNYCTGCEIEVFDAAFLIVIASFALILSAFANPSFSKRVSKRDALRIVRECMWSWLIGGLFYNLSFILFLADPGNLYKQGIFNWRFVKLIATGVLFHIQTIHQIVVSKRLKREVLLAPMLDQAERYTEVVNDKALKDKLERFLDSELSAEILKFIHQVDLFKANFEKEGAQSRARQIFSTFIIRGSPSEINISSELRAELLHRMPPGNFEVGVFDRAYSEVKKNFLEDGFARFVKRLEKEQNRATKTVAVYNNTGV